MGTLLRQIVNAALVVIIVYQLAATFTTLSTVKDPTGEPPSVLVEKAAKLDTLVLESKQTQTTQMSDNLPERNTVVDTVYVVPGNLSAPATIVSPVFLVFTGSGQEEMHKLREFVGVSIL